MQTGKRFEIPLLYTRNICLGIRVAQFRRNTASATYLDAVYDPCAFLFLNITKRPNKRRHEDYLMVRCELVSNAFCCMAPTAKGLFSWQAPKYMGLTLWYSVSDGVWWFKPKNAHCRSWQQRNKSIMTNEGFCCPSLPERQTSQTWYAKIAMTSSLCWLSNTMINSKRAYNCSRLKDVISGNILHCWLHICELNHFHLIIGGFGLTHGRILRSRPTFCDYWRVSGWGRRYCLFFWWRW